MSSAIPRLLHNVHKYAPARQPSDRQTRQTDRPSIRLDTVRHRQISFSEAIERRARRRIAFTGLFFRKFVPGSSARSLHGFAEEKDKEVLGRH